MKKIYLAGPCDTDNRTMMWKIATLLSEDNEFEVYCPWTYKVPDAWTYSQEDWAAFVFSQDIVKIQECDVFLMISVGRQSTAGTNWEQGYAWGLGKDTIVIQINDKPASLMTYHGCDMYINTNMNDLDYDMEYVKSMLHHTSDHWVKEKCLGVLT